MLKKALAFIDAKSASIAILAGGFVQFYLMFLAIDSMMYYGIGIWRVSPIVRGAALLIIGVLLLRKLATSSIKYDALLATLIAYALVCSIVGITNDGAGYIFGRQLFAAITMIACYWLGLYLQDISTKVKEFHAVAIATLLGCIIFVFVAVATEKLGHAFTSLGASIPLLFALDFSLIAGRIPLLLVCLAIILVTNLRMGVIGASIMIATYVCFRYLKRPAHKVLIAPVFAILLFVAFTGAILTIDKVGSIVAGYSVGERAHRTLDAITAMVPMHKGPDHVGNAKHPDIQEIMEHVSTNRLSQALAVFKAVNVSTPSLLLGLGFGSEYSWDYYSTYEKAWQHYVFHQTDMMAPYFLLTGGILFAVLVPVLIVWRMARVYLNMVPELKLGGLFVLGFGATMFFGFQPNVPLFWLLLGALSTGTTAQEMKASATDPLS